MPLLPIHKYFIYNGVLKSNSEFTPSENEGGIYEVLRVVNGIPLFWEDHLLRFYKSAKIANKKIIYSELEILNFIKILIQQNDYEEGNLLISCKKNLKIFYIPHRYPSPKLHKEGVDCGILKAERKDPNAKVFQTSVRENANEIISKKGVYEVFLINKLGQVTEGSRSNLFFVKGNKIITSPGDNVLLGITRQKTIVLAKKLKFDFEEQPVMLKDLHSFDAVFITGTSAKILPVKKVERSLFNSQNNVLRKLMGEYDKEINEYIKSRLTD